MAETVKKSRIVSETDNLEEAVMEEFNMRLKKCMSQEDLQTPSDQHQQHNEDLDAKRNDRNDSRDFIRAERENYYEQPVETNGMQKHNGYHKVQPDEAVYENVAYHVDETDRGRYDDVAPKSPEYEEIEGGSHHKPDLTLTDLCEVGDAEVEIKSVKDRMLLSTDDAPCLFFTQTVTSPMLTPSEESIDFLKGFRRESASNGDGDQSQNVYENSESIKGSEEKRGEFEMDTQLRGDSEPVYENLKEVQENIYENLKDLESKEDCEAIYQNVGVMRDEAQSEPTETENSCLIEDDNDDSDKIEDEEEAVIDTKLEIDEEVRISTAKMAATDSSTQVTEAYEETTTVESNSQGDKGFKKKRSKKSRKEEKENISVHGTNNYNEDLSYNVNVKTLKSSFTKFEALQKKNILHVRSSDAAQAQEKFIGAQVESSNCRDCGKTVFQMEQIKAEKSVWHKNCFRCKECNKQLNVDTYQSNEGTLYCKPHFKALFAPKAVEEDASPSDKPDLGLEELQSLNVKERFQVFEHYQSETSEDRGLSFVNVKRSPSILSKLAKFQAKGMDIGVADESLNGIPIEESSSEEEGDVEDVVDGEDADLIRAKKVHKEKPFHFTGMLDVKNKWEQGEQHSSRDERREERKQEIQSIRNRLFMGKQGKMKEAYQQAVMESESCLNLRKEPIEVCDTKSLKERFEKGELTKEPSVKEKSEDSEVFESEISKKSRSLFLELDATASRAPQITPVSTPKADVKKARENYLMSAASEDVVKSSSEPASEEVQVETADIQQRFRFFETYKEPERKKDAFRMTPPPEGQVKDATSDTEVVRSEEIVEDSAIARETRTATNMLSKFRQMEENLTKEPTVTGPKPLKRFTPPPEPVKSPSGSEAESGSEEESEDEDEVDQEKVPDEDLIEARKAARAKQLRAKFERWEANEIQKEQNNSTVNVIEEFGDEQSQVESTKSLRARFESLKENSTETNKSPRVKVNRFVELPNVTETCDSCNSRVYPLEKVSVHNAIYHKNCFKCMECNCILRMDSYSYNQGLLYCMPHFKRLFISKGNYDTGFGFDQHKGKWNTTIA